MARCDWHVGDLGLPDDVDPLQDIAQLQASAPVIDLSMSEAALHAEWEALADKEARYAAWSKDDDGVTPLSCALKASPQHSLVTPGAALSCFNCPHHVSDKASAKSLLCILGRKQHNVLEMIEGVQIADSLETELIAAYTHDIEESAELAEAWLAAA